MSAPSNSTELSALFGPGPACAALSVVLPAGLVIFAIATIAGQAVPFVAVIAMVLFVQAALSARSDALVLGIAVVGLLFALSDAGFVTMAIAGAILFLTFVLHDLSRSLRRKPAVSATFTRGLAASTMGVIVVGWLIAAVAAAIGGSTVWPALVVPVAVVAVGLFLFMSLQQLIDRNPVPEPDRP